MSLKGIELQIAIPKTFDAGKIAEQKQQLSQLNQDHANMRTEKQSLQNSETVVESEKYAKTSADHHTDDEGQSEDGEMPRNDYEEEKKSVHPYKGSFIDFSG